MEPEPAHVNRTSPWGHRPLQRTDLLDARQVAELLGLVLKCSTVEDYARRGELRCVRLGRHRRFLRADVEAYVLSRRA